VSLSPTKTMAWPPLPRHVATRKRQAFGLGFFL
jgi:hypothetical protein